MSDLFRYTRGPHDAKVMLIGEAWGENEAEQQVPFVGASGAELERMLREAGIDPAEVLFANVVNARPSGNDITKFLIPTEQAKKAKMPPFRGLYPGIPILEGISKLENLIAHVKPKLILSVGNWPLWFLTESSWKVKNEKGYKLPTGVDTYRGSQLFYERAGSPIPVLPTYHPAAILRMWSWRHISVQDFRRGHRYLSGGAGAADWQDPREFKWLLQPSVPETRGWVEHFLVQKGDTLELELDLETYMGRIHIFGVRNPLDETCLVVPFLHVRKDGFSPAYPESHFVAIYMRLRQLLCDSRIRLTGQNLIYDIQYLREFFHYTPIVGFDTMIAQNVFSPGERKSLDFMASIYCQYYTYWKEDRKKSLANESTEEGMRYNAMDLEYTSEVAAVLRGILTHTQKWHLFAKRMRLQAHLFLMMNRGVRVNVALRKSQHEYLKRMIEDVELWLEGAVPDEVKPERLKTKTGKWKTAAWYNSDTQLKKIIYGAYKCRPVYDDKTAQPTLAKGALETLCERYPALGPLFNMIALLRSLHTYKENFYDSRIDPDMRMRCAYNPAGTETFRLSSSENVFDRGHNLTNVPRDRQTITCLNAIEVLT